MKNKLIILLDTENGVQIGKDFQPGSQEELNEGVILDIATLCEALVVTIRAAHQMGVKPESDSIRDSIKHIQDSFVDSGLTIVTPQSKHDKHTAHGK